MKTQIIINHTATSRPLVRMRDLVLLLTCWALWSAVLLALFNGCEWDELGLAFQQLLAAQEVFFASLLASFHIPPLYVFTAAMMFLVFLLWSLCHLALAPLWRKQRRVAPLSVADMARHFHLDMALVDAMQKEKRILVVHTMSGAVTELRQVSLPVQPQLLQA